MTRRSSVAGSGSPTFDELHHRYKVTYANAAGPFPVPFERSTAVMGLVTGLIALFMIASAPIWWALATEAVFVMLPLAPERLREQWTWTAWLGAVGAGAAAAGRVVARHLGGSGIADETGAITALAYGVVFCWRHAQCSSTGRRRFRLVALVGAVLALSALALLSTNAW